MVRPLTTSSATIFRAQSEERFARIEAALERLAEAQARTEVEFREYRERSEERLARIEATLDRLAEAQAQTEAQMRALAEAQAQTEAQMRALAEAQARTEAEFREYRERSEERLARIEATLDRLAEAQAQTEAQMRALAEKQARTEAEFREYRERSEERLARIEATLDRLAEAQAQTEAQMRALAEAQAQTEAQMRALAEAQAQTEAQMRALAEKQAQTEKVLQSLIATQQKFEERLQRLEIRVGQMDGDLLEIRYQERATSYFGRILRRLKVVSISDILDTLEERLSPDEVEELFNLDLLIRGRIRGSPGETGPEVWLAVEISALIDTEDVERALQRAILLRKAGYPAIPTVAGRNISPVAETVARREGVVIVQDGRSTLWQEAFAQWESNQA